MKNAMNCVCQNRGEFVPGMGPTVCPSCGREWRLFDDPFFTYTVHLIQSESKPEYSPSYLIRLGYLEAAFTAVLLLPLLLLFYIFGEKVGVLFFAVLVILGVICCGSFLWYMFTREKAMATGCLLICLLITAATGAGYLVNSLFGKVTAIGYMVLMVPVIHVISSRLHARAQKIRNIYYEDLRDDRAFLDRIAAESRLVLLLRSVKEDDAIITTEYFPNRMGPFIKLPTNHRESTIENAVAEECEQSGYALVKVMGDPMQPDDRNDNVARVVLTPNDRWKRRVSSLLDRATHGILIVGPTPGLAWEMDYVFQSKNRVAKTIFVFPATDTRTSWSLLERWAARSEYKLPGLPQSPFPAPLMVRFAARRHLECVLIVTSSAKINKECYRLGLRRLLRPPA
jgi:hypothetical protein